MYVERMSGPPPFCERCDERYGAKPAPSSITPEDSAKIAAGLAILISMIVGMCSYLYRNRSAIAEKSKAFMEGAKTAVLTSVDAARQLLRRCSVPRTQIDIPSQHEAVMTPQTEQSHPLQEPEAVVSQEWFVRRGDIERGPLTPSKVKQLVSKGILAATDFVRTAEEPQWRKAGTVKDLFEEDPSDSEIASLTIIRKPKLTAKQQRQENIAKLEQQLIPLQARLQKVATTTVLEDWGEWVKSKLPEAFKTPLYIAICVLCCVTIYPALGIVLCAWITTFSRETVLNKQINDEIASINTQIADLKGQP